MALTDSLDIITIIRENVEMITLGTNPQTYSKFFSTAEWEHNLLDDPDNFPLTFLLRPITENGKVGPQGNPEGTYPLLIFFFSGKVEINAPQTDKDVLLAKARAMKRQFIIRLNEDGRVKKLTDYTCDEILEDRKFDINPTGVFLKISVVVDDTGSVCLS